jgi:general secretion pathway protein G
MNRQSVSVSGRNPRGSMSGFTLVEILIVVIILGILAAIVIPQFTDATENARKANLKNQLQTMRAAIQLYRVQHKDKTPDLITTPWAPFVGKTDSDGNPSVNDRDWGPYMQDKPTNPLAGTATISDTPDAGVGWVYDQASGTIVATQDADGTLFDENTN